MRDHTVCEDDGATGGPVEDGAVGGSDDYTVPVDKVLTVIEISTMSNRLERAVVVEYDRSVSSSKAVSLAVASNDQFVCLSSLSPFKLILFFDTESEMRNAIDVASPLWTHFTKVRRWEDGEECGERVAVVECVGIHPKCWSLANITKIGENWGSVLHMDQEANGVHSLTFARVVIRTQVQYNIEARVQLVWESRSFVVWVKECGDGAMGVIDMGMGPLKRGRRLMRRGETRMCLSMGL